MSPEELAEIETALRVLRELPERLRAHRFELNLSQPATSLAIGLNDRAVANIESGFHRPGSANVERILDWMVRSANDAPQPGEPREHVSERTRKASAARKDRQHA